MENTYIMTIMSKCSIMEAENNKLWGVYIRENMGQRELEAYHRDRGFKRSIIMI